jgi:photosystem II stability/assembly factor-like uncharacterized protein
MKKSSRFFFNSILITSLSLNCIISCKKDDTTSQLKAQWHQTGIIQDAEIENISVINDNVLWVTDKSADTISITTDGGASWTSKPFPVPPNSGIAGGGICALSESKAYCIVSNSDLKGIYITTDGGNNWTQQTTGFNINSTFPDVIYFWNDNEGVAIGDAAPNFEIYTTTNGGEQWNRVPDENMPSGQYEGLYNTQQFFRIAGNSFFFMTSVGTIFKSSDKGNNWSAVITPFYYSADAATGFAFKDNNNGLICSYAPYGSNNRIFRTTDGGKTWNRIITENFYDNLKYLPSANIYLSMSSSRGLSYSADDGETWTNIPYFDGIKTIDASCSTSGKLFLGSFKSIYYSDNIAVN